MRRLRIYLDTSVINFLFADDAPEKRDATRDFFARYVDTGHYEVAVSVLVVAEIERTRDAVRRKTLLDAISGHTLKQLPIEPREHSTISRAQREVWEWKEAAYREVESLPRRDALLDLLRKAEKAAKAAGMHLELMRPPRAIMTVAEEGAEYGREDGDEDTTKA